MVHPSCFVLLEWENSFTNFANTLVLFAVLYFIGYADEDLSSMVCIREYFEQGLGATHWVSCFLNKLI